MRGGGATRGTANESHIPVSTLMGTVRVVRRRRRKKKKEKKEEMEEEDDDEWKL